MGRCLCNPMVLVTYGQFTRTLRIISFWLEIISLLSTSVSVCVVNWFAEVHLRIKLTASIVLYVCYINNHHDSDREYREMERLVIDILI